MLASIVTIGLFVHQVARAALIIAALLAVEISPAGFLYTRIRTFILWRRQNILRHKDSSARWRTEQPCTALSGLKIPMSRNISVQLRRSPTSSPPRRFGADTCFLHPRSTAVKLLSWASALVPTPAIRMTRDRWTYFEIDPVVIKIARDKINLNFCPAAHPTRGLYWAMRV